MKILVIGQGGREHTLVWKIAQSQHVEKIYCTPGNAGIAQISEIIPMPDQFTELADWAESQNIGLTIVGPENPLAEGIVDIFQERGLKAFGPNKRAARLEASKDFAKQLMEKNGIPTAAHRTFTDIEKAMAYIEDYNAPVFVKADGLAAGKGVIPGRTFKEALQAVTTILVDRAFGDAGNSVVIEEELIGEEASFTVLTDGTYCLPFVSSQDHKMSHDGDKGKNTGGMGAYSPAPVITPELHDYVMNHVVYPTVNGMAAIGSPFKGVLYVGLMITDAGPKVLEFNCRFGDPEAQVLLPRLKSDLVPLLIACIDGTLEQHADVQWHDEAAACVVMASGGYPDPYETGQVITGLEDADTIEGVTVFHAGTKQESENILTAGGRVLGVTAVADGLHNAIQQAYRGVSAIHFDKAHTRSDIGYRALEKSQK
ncbi:phosphoribosylamine--glycine ligase [Candidatus Poribacteria bacterium]|nr:phosphoribosylamine--glycine ligase [Candidatus Poribacteria bacterium]MYG05606.1 phosphoribosylamine--glycine ligase [Candidatus Poribacteria bacterium]MYK23889.1 phosphoribosylamine--glycine ligase [Candidatus Poribacteria bacterium]